MAITGLLQNHNHDDRYIQKSEQNKVWERWQGNQMDVQIKIPSYQICYVYYSWNAGPTKWLQFPVEFCNNTQHLVGQTDNNIYLTYQGGTLRIKTSNNIRILKIYSTW